MHRNRSSVRRPWLLAGLLLFLLPIRAAAQGETGFLRGRGKLDLVLGVTRDEYDHFWLGDQKVSDPGVGDVTRTGYGIYAAYGATDALDLILAASYVSAEADGSGGFPDQDDPQDLLLAAKWRVFEHRAENGASFNAALLPGIKVPSTAKAGPTSGRA